MNYDKQLMEVFNLMPLSFSGKQFAAECIEQGIDPEIISKGITTSFLHLNADIIKGTRSWIKKDAIQVTNENTTYEQECIQYLKEKGYKILKLNWEEQ